MGAALCFPEISRGSEGKGRIEVGQEDPLCDIFDYSLVEDTVICAWKVKGLVTEMRPPPRLSLCLRQTETDVCSKTKPTFWFI